MFYVRKPTGLNAPWILSRNDDKNIVFIAEDVTKAIKNYQILGVDYLYQNNRKQFKGAILNEEPGMNMPLQVSAFFNAMLGSIKEKLLLLIIAGDKFIANWHYHLSVHSGLKVKIITAETNTLDLENEDSLALLLSHSNIKLAGNLIDYDFFSVVIDDFDEVATKLVIRRLHGEFNIGLTQRSFYLNPNQKLQWTMLNWSNPGCVGKLLDFYEIDNDNFANYRDNYRHWWFRLTWQFCESFEKPTTKEKKKYAEIISKWSLDKHLIKCEQTATNKTKRKRKVDFYYKEEKMEIVEEELQVTETNVIDNFESSNMKKGRIKDPNYVELPSMDENPILNSIIRNLEKSPEPIKTYKSPFEFSSKYDLNQPTCSKVLEDNDILLSIISDNENSSSPLNCEEDVSGKKKKVSCDYLHSEPCTSKSLRSPDDGDFFSTLFTSDDEDFKESKVIVEDDIEKILKESQRLLND